MGDVLDEKPEVEYIDGRPYPRVGFARTHAVVEGQLSKLLQSAAGERGAVGIAWRCRLAPGSEFVPDVAYVSYERLRALSDEEAEEPPFAPDIAGEVRSPSCHAGLLAKKIEQYLSHGAVLVLDVDPAGRAVHAHSADAKVTFKTGEHFISDALPWLEFDVGELFENLKIPR